MSTRGGQAPNKKTQSVVLKRKCERIFKNMVIRPTGKISLCCCDALGKYTMGDVNVDSLEKIWKTSTEYMHVRKHMIREGRFGLELCEKCDFK